jgi:hypothetical protein
MGAYSTCKCAVTIQFPESWIRQASRRKAWTSPDVRYPTVARDEKRGRFRSYSNPIGDVGDSGLPDYLRTLFC